MPRSSPDDRPLLHPLSLPELAGKTITLEDLLGEARYVRDGRDLLDRGLFLELPADGHHLFRIRGHLTPNDD